LPSGGINAELAQRIYDAFHDKAERPSNHATEPAHLLTLLRIALIPVFVGVFFSPFPGANLLCTALFGLAALTDWLDGYLARRLGQTSAFGAFLIRSPTS
jgi:phosphatidylglycerophosphate synthase